MSAKSQDRWSISTALCNDTCVYMLTGAEMVAMATPGCVYARALTIAIMLDEQTLGVVE